MLVMLESFENLETIMDEVRLFQKTANILPIISKGDHLTTTEIRNMKQNIHRYSRSKGIEWFNC